MVGVIVSLGGVFGQIRLEFYMGSRVDNARVVGKKEMTPDSTPSAHGPLWWTFWPCSGHANRWILLKKMEVVCCGVAFCSLCV